LGYKFAYLRKDGSFATDFIFDDGDDIIVSGTDTTTH
jgi:hypothetical protein